MDPRDASPTPAAAKKALRRQLWERRKELARRPRSERDAEAVALAGHGLPLVRELVPAGGTVLSYESWPAEPGTHPLNARLQAEGYRVLVPVTLPDLDLSWRDLADPDEPEHHLGREAVTVADLVLAPGTAVDQAGVRLGQGGGCYDRALTRVRPGVRVVTLLHPHELRTEPLPRAEHDQLVDGVLTVGGVTWLSPRRPDGA